MMRTVWLMNPRTGEMTNYSEDSQDIEIICRHIKEHANKIRTPGWCRLEDICIDIDNTLLDDFHFTMSSKYGVHV